ncbi:VgrG-related protein [Streptomyces sp. NPDC019443]|uniref:VgrG-related protein n=1 Tax=Streptomyces sp. NPDC019443 TaxID=3365061 RepID=UPI003787D407
MTQISYSNVFNVKIKGRPLTATVEPLLVGGTVDFGAGVPAAFELTFRDPNALVLQETGALIGSRVELAPISAGEGEMLITGEITGLETDYDGTGTFTVIRGYDHGHRMLRQRRVSAYRNMTAAVIARKLAGLNKIKVGRIQPTKIIYEFITQANVTDWDFLCRLADENDMVMSLNSQGRFQFVTAPPAAGAPAVSTPSENNAFVLEAGTDILRCRAAVTSADQVTNVEARGWDVTAKRALIGTSPAATYAGVQIGSTPAAAKVFGAAKLVATETPYDKQGQVQQAAKSLADDVTAAFAELEVTVRGNPKLRTGVPVTLTKVGNPFDGKYTVTGARHTFGDGRHYECLLSVSGRQWRSLYGLSSGAGAVSPMLPSVANALVTDIKDPLRQGRVKLRFPWLDDKYVSDWTRTVQFGGVKGGGVIAPDVGDEVLVAFDRGALDHPYVIGGLYNGKDNPAPVDVPLYDPTRGKATRHTLADRDGNRLDLLDQRVGLKRGVRLATGDNRLTINLDRTRTEITVDSKGSVTITGTRSVSIDAGANLSLSAVGRLSLKSGGPLSITSGSVLNVKAAGAANLDAAGAVNVKTGGMINATAGGMVSLTAGATVQLTAAANIGLKAGTITSMGLLTSNAKPVLTVGGV